ncbi:hypothetical protein [Naasia lichenicola]|uniref:hypothetical protein n=1 Tax=Naasia lichenicola TaxID=2565933 RepID=UPI001E58096C|nr:hypothetical protein [Naasia lichenicola]
MTTTPPGAGQFEVIVGYASFLALAICILSLLGLVATFVLRARRGETPVAVSKLGIILIASMLISGSAALVSSLLPAASPSGSSSTVGFLQSSIWFYVGALAVLAIIVAGLRMAWDQRAAPGRELLQSLVTLIVVSGAGLTVIGLAVAAADSFSVWILNTSTDCDVESATSPCFGENVSALLVGLSATSPIGLIGVLILGSIALIVTYVQVALMVVRGGLLVILAGILPLTASFTNTAMGKQWFRRSVGWLIAFILYKPAAALVYAAAFRLVATNVFQQDGTGIWSVLTGLALMVMALAALPALMRFVTPLVAPLAADGGGAAFALVGAGGLVAGELATGAISRFGSSGGSGGAGPSSPGPSGAGGGGTPSGGMAGGAPSGGASGAATGGAKAGAAGGAAGASAGAAAAGPVGAVLIAGEVVSQVGRAAQGANVALRKAGESSTGDGESPSGAK